MGDFEKEASEWLENFFKHNNIVVMVGGSGLYSDAITEGLDDFPDINSEIRKRLLKELDENGLIELQQELKTLDPLSYRNIDLQNPHRVIRALEVTLGSDKPYSAYLNKKKNKRPFKVIKVGLTADRNIIYQRINQRVDKMVEAGLVQEAESLYNKRHLNALNTVGYKEIFEYLDGNCTLKEAVEEIKKNTRRFAKRQLTWYRKDPDIIWFDYQTPVDDIIHTINKKLSTYED